MGLRLDWLGSERLTWRDLWVIVEQQPATSALIRARDPEGSEWHKIEHLAAGIFDALQVANWQRGRARRGEFPKPLPRPGVEPESQMIGSGKGIPMDEMAERLGWTAAVEPVRIARGRLTPDEVREIRRSASAVSVAELANQFGVSRSTVANVIARRTWKNVN